MAKDYYVPSRDKDKEIVTFSSRCKFSGKEYTQNVTLDFSDPTTNNICSLSSSHLKNPLFEVVFNPTDGKYHALINADGLDISAQAKLGSPTSAGTYDVVVDDISVIDSKQTTKGEEKGFQISLQGGLNINSNARAFEISRKSGTTKEVISRITPPDEETFSVALTNKFFDSAADKTNSSVHLKAYNRAVKDLAEATPNLFSPEFMLSLAKLKAHNSDTKDASYSLGDITFYNGEISGLDKGSTVTNDLTIIKHGNSRYVLHDGVFFKFNGVASTYDGELVAGKPFDFGIAVTDGKKSVDIPITIDVNALGSLDTDSVGYKQVANIVSFLGLTPASSKPKSNDVNVAGLIAEQSDGTTIPTLNSLGVKRPLYELDPSAPTPTNEDLQEEIKKNSDMITELGGLISELLRFQADQFEKNKAEHEKIQQTLESIKEITDLLPEEHATEKKQLDDLLKKSASFNLTTEENVKLIAGLLEKVQAEIVGVKSQYADLHKETLDQIDSIKNVYKDSDKSADILSKLDEIAQTLKELPDISNEKYKELLGAIKTLSEVKDKNTAVDRSIVDAIMNGNTTIQNMISEKLDESQVKITQQFEEFKKDIQGLTTDKKVLDRLEQLSNQITGQIKGISDQKTVDTILQTVTDIQTDLKKNPDKIVEAIDNVGKGISKTILESRQLTKEKIEDVGNKVDEINKEIESKGNEILFDIDETKKHIESLAKDFAGSKTELLEHIDKLAKSGEKIEIDLSLITKSLEAKMQENFDLLNDNLSKIAKAQKINDPEWKPLLGNISTNITSLTTTNENITIQQDRLNQISQDVQNIYNIISPTTTTPSGPSPTPPGTTPPPTPPGSTPPLTPPTTPTPADVAPTGSPAVAPAPNKEKSEARSKMFKQMGIFCGFVALFALGAMIIPGLNFLAASIVLGIALTGAAAFGLAAAFPVTNFKSSLDNTISTAKHKIKVRNHKKEKFLARERRIEEIKSNMPTIDPMRSSPKELKAIKKARNKAQKKIDKLSDKNDKIIEKDPKIIDKIKKAKQSSFIQTFAAEHGVEPPQSEIDEVGYNFVYDNQYAIARSMHLHRGEKSARNAIVDMDLTEREVVRYASDEITDYVDQGYIDADQKKFLGTKPEKIIEKIKCDNAWTNKYIDGISDIEFESNTIDETLADFNKLEAFAATRFSDPLRKNIEKAIKDLTEKKKEAHVFVDSEIISDAEPAPEATVVKPDADNIWVETYSEEDLQEDLSVKKYKLDAESADVARNLLRNKRDKKEHERSR